jgi:hypothetical protein
MKFSQAPVAPPRTAPATIPTVAGVEMACRVRHLMAEQEAAILVDARAFAKSRGAEDPRPDDPLYIFGMMVSTVLRGYVDADTQPDAPGHLDPFFDGGVEQILRHLDQDRIAYLWAVQCAFQDKCSGRAVALTDAEVLVRVHAIAAADPNDPGPFVDLRPLQQQQLMRSMARLILSLSSLVHRAARPPGSEAEPARPGADQPSGAAPPPSTSTP